MKLHPIVFPALALAGAFTFAFAQEKKEPNFTVSPDKIAKIDASLPGKTPAPVGKKHEVLVFTRTVGFRHGSIPVGVEAMKRMGEKTGLFHVTHTEDPAAFEADSLKKFDAIFMLNTTNEVFDTGDKAVEERLKANLLAFVDSGKGIVGIHSATDTYKGWKEYNEMMGGAFVKHPWNSGDTVRVKNLDPKHPVNAGRDAVAASRSRMKRTDSPRSARYRPVSSRTVPSALAAYQRQRRCGTGPSASGASPTATPGCQRRSTAGRVP